jgi:electron transfer flavoprotein beta subunit
VRASATSAAACRQRRQAAAKPGFARRTPGPARKASVKIVVCVKQVGALGDEVEFTEDERDVDPDFLDYALNEWDGYATEEALQLRERGGGDGEIVLVTCGDEESEAALRRALAMGADRAIRVWSEELRGADPITVARALAPVVAAESPDLVLTGVQSSDSVQAATGTGLAELLELPRAAVVTKVSWDARAGSATVHRELEGGLVDVVEVDTPAVLTIQTGINEPRYATLRAIKQAEQKEIDAREPEDVGDAAYRVRRMFVPPKGEGAEMLDGSPADVAQRIAAIVKERLA